MAGERTIKIRFTGYVDALKKATKEGGSAIEGLQNRVAKFELAAAAGAAGAVTAIGAIAAQAQNVGAHIAAQLGETSGEAAAYGKIAGQVYAKGWGDGLEGVGAAITAIRRTKLVDEDATAAEIKKITQQALILSDVFGKDVTESTRAVQQLIRNGLVKDATEGFDLITRGIQEGVDKSDDLLDTFNEYSTQFRVLGLQGPAALGLLSQGLKAGARDADTVADSLKEFAIRAVDGSKTSADGYKAIGLSAEKMTAQIAKGGAGAQAGLDQVLDGLRGIEDPVKRNGAAVALFGTKAEDLGASLFALDVTTATAGLDNLAGATERAGNVAHNTAQAKLTALWRGLQQTFVEMLGGRVLPVVERVTGYLQRNLGPALQATGGWIQRNREWLEPTAVALGTFAGAILVVSTAMKVWRAITAAVTVVQTALSVAMSANPIGLIVLAIAALIAGLTYAYYHSEKFRKIVDAVFRAVGIAATWLWENAIKPLWQGMQIAFTAMLEVVSWWWGAASTYFRLVGAIFGWLYDNVIKPWWAGVTAVFRGVAAVATWLYENGIKPAFAAVSSAIGGVINFVRSLAAIWLWLQGAILGPILAGIGALFGWLYQHAVLPLWQGIQLAFAGIALVAAWLYDQAILPLWNGIKTAAAGIGGVISWLYTYGIKAPADAIGGVFSWLWSVASDAFGRVMGVARQVGDTFRDIFGKIGGFISSGFGNAVGVVKGVINNLIGLVNSATRTINNSVVDKLNKVPGVSFGSIPSIPMLARGGTARGGRPHWVGEQGPELFVPGRTGTVVPNDALGGGGPMVVEIPIYIGDEVVRVVRGEISESNRGLRRRVLAGAGAQR